MISFGFIQVVNDAAPSVSAWSIEWLWLGAAVEEQALGAKSVHRRFIAEVQSNLFAKALIGVSAKAFFVDDRAGYLRAAVEHGVPVQFLFQEGHLMLCIQRDPVAEISAFGTLKALIEFAPVHCLAAGDPVDTQPLRINARCGERFAAPRGQGLPDGGDVVTGDMGHGGSLIAVGG